MTVYYLYLIATACKSAVKVGIATNTTKRLRALQSSTHLALSLIDRWKVPYKNRYKIERIIRVRLKPHHIRGEWFSCQAEQAAALVREEMGNTQNGTNIPVNIPDKPLFPDRCSASRKGALIGAARKKAAVDKMAKGLTREEWTNGDIKNADLVKKYGPSINALKRYAGDKGWGHDRQRAIWRAETRRKKAKEA